MFSATDNTADSHRRAFSLIELLVVITIVGVLVSLVIPSISKSREQARRVVCASQMRQMNLVFTAYDYSFKELPPGNDGTKGGPIGASVHIILRDEYNVPKKMTICPSGVPPRDTNRQWDDNNAIGGLGYQYQAGHGNRPSFPASFGWDASGFPLRTVGYFPMLSYIRRSPHAFVQLPPGQLPVMRDNAYWVNPSLYASAYNPALGSSTGPLPHQYLSPFPSHVGPRAYSAEGGNILYGDGRVDWQNMRPGESWLFSQAGGNSGYLNPRGGPPPVTAPLTVSYLF
jgi:prepilin-type N-terminal cleavage/methylation domain-containing protein